MKKIIAFLLIISMLFCITACGGSEDEEEFDKGGSKGSASKNPGKNDTDTNKPTDEPDDSKQGGESEDNPYMISTADALYKFVEDYNAYKLDAAICVKLGADIKVNDIADVYMDLTADNLDGYRMWTPVQYFRGTFDGDGHTISGIVCSMDTDKNGTIVCSSALFASMAEGSVVKNLTVKDSIFTSKTKNYAAGICGSLRKGTIENCHNYAKILTYSTSGGIAAANGGGVIKNCSNYANISNIDTGSTKGLGGICGYNVTDYETKTVSRIVNCVNYGNLVGVDTTGGIAGYNRGFVEGCINKGKIQSKNDAGGITGSNTSNGDEIGNVVNCINYGNIESDNYAGGISVENCSGAEFELIYGIQNCINYGNVSGGNDSGGICVYTSDAIVANCANWGNVTARSDAYWGAAASGICVDVRDGAKICNSFNAGSVTSSHEATGLCDSIRGEVSGCYSAGIIRSEKTTACGIATEVYDGKVLDCFFIGEIYGNEKSNYMIKDLFEDDVEKGYVCASCHLNRSLAKDSAWYIGFDFDEVWTMNPFFEYAYPTLRNMPEDFTK